MARVSKKKTKTKVWTEVMVEVVEVISGLCQLLA
jgi:hypothetical protein